MTRKKTALDVPFEKVVVSIEEVHSNAQWIRAAQLYSNGFNAKEIGTLMEISPRTVESYMVRLKDKFGCRTLVEAIAELLRKKVIQ